MADSIREQIAQAIVTRLETILTVNTYVFNSGQNVNRAKKNYDEEDLPAMTLWQGVEISKKEYGHSKKTMVIDIESMRITDDVLTDDAQANQMIADIQRCIGTYDASLMSLIEGVTETNTEPVYPSDGSDIISAKVTYEFVYNMVNGDPYLQP